jgi:hypothetical protein
MLYPVRLKTDILTGNGAPTLGNTFSFPITREFFLSSLYIVIPFTVTATEDATESTWQTMGLAELITQVQLNIADGSTNRNQTAASGGALIRRAARIVSGLDIQLGALQGTFAALGANLNLKEAAVAGSSAGVYYLTVPMFFRHPQISDPIGSATMLPLPRYNTNPVLTITLGQLTNALITNGGLSITIGDGGLYPMPYIVRVMRQVDNILFPTLDTEFKEIASPQSSTGANLRQTLDVPGSYTAIDIYCQTAAGTGADISNGLWNLQFLSQVLRQFYLPDVKRFEQYSMGNDATISQGGGAFIDPFPGYFHLDFLHDEYGMEVGELGSLLNVNVLAGSGALLEIIMQLGSTGTINFASERIFGDLSPYTLQFNTAAG